MIACAGESKDDAKGQVDDSEPPAIPTELGKADAAAKTIAVDVQSAHPYTNNFSRAYSVPLNLPSCATTARLHFKVLRLEQGYDFVSIDATGEEFTGNRDGTWTAWFPRAASATVRLETDGSITRHGFEIDKVEWNGQPTGCATHPGCGAGKVNLAKRPGTCQCAPAPVCAPIANVVVQHHLYRGFDNTTKTARGATAEFTHPGPADEPVTDTVGTVDTIRLAAIVRRAAELGLLQGSGYTKPVAGGAYTARFSIKAGAYTVNFLAAKGAHAPDVQALIDDFESLFACGSGGGLTCGSGWTCGTENACIEEANCFCPAVYDPQCGIDGHTYSNACAAGCADMPIAHPGQCGITGDTCGTIAGLACADGHKCRFGEGVFEAPWPDAGGTCVVETYCDAPPDCAGLPHIAVPGSWACESNTCAWKAGLAWKPVTGGHFETPNPYANGQSVWHQVYLPAEAQAMRLMTSRFRLENNYDKLEVWTWRNNAWAKVKSYTGTAGPSPEDEFGGRYHYLRFVSDSSVTDAGFALDAQWR